MADADSTTVSSEQTHFFWYERKTHKRCRYCNEVKPRSQFHKSRSMRDGLHSYCKVCALIAQKCSYWSNLDQSRQRHRRMQRKHWRKQYLKASYAISPEDYERMRIEQADRCAICGTLCKPTLAKDNKIYRTLLVDHNHTTSQVRGLLCSQCNLGIGCFCENANHLHAATAYLEYWSERFVAEQNDA